LGVAERLVSAARGAAKVFNVRKPDMEDYDFYMGVNEYGVPRLMEQVYPSVRSQIKDFVKNVVLA
jgi:hypothetical protein